jgi:uncharacterized protein (DUF1684 family)
MIMSESKVFLLLTIVLLVASGCNSPQGLIEDEQAYVQEIEEWQHSRVERLKGKNGWLNLAGLLWLEEGKNSFGSDPANDLIFPEKAAASCGSLTLADGVVTLKVKNGVKITTENVPVTTLILNDDQSKPTTYLQQGDLAWNIIKRGDEYGIRLRDHKHPRIEKLDHIPAYPINFDYVVEAKLHPFEEPRIFTVATPVEGFTESYPCPGELHFKILDEELVLYPFTSGEGYFLIIADETTGMETYGAGRFMYAPPDSTGRIILDFNKAYNPPCAFSPYATCPMPPRDNFLPVAIEAGEKAVHLD